MVKIKAIVSYRDLELKRTILKGEELEVNDERAKVLIEKKLVDEIIKNSPEIEEDIIEEKIVKPTKKISPKKK